MFIRDWKEEWVGRMGLIVALSGEERFAKLEAFKLDMLQLTIGEKADLIKCLAQRFTTSNGQDGCQSATAAVKEVTNEA